MAWSARTRWPLAGLLLVFLAADPASAQGKPRARDLNIPLPGSPGPLNAITDVSGVEVGHATLIRGDGRRERGKGPVRTGVPPSFRGESFRPTPCSRGFLR